MAPPMSKSGPTSFAGPMLVDELLNTDIKTHAETEPTSETETVAETVAETVGETVGESEAAFVKVSNPKPPNLGEDLKFLVGARKKILQLRAGTAYGTGEVVAYFEVEEIPSTHQYCRRLLSTHGKRFAEENDPSNIGTSDAGVSKAGEGDNEATVPALPFALSARRQTAGVGSYDTKLGASRVWVDTNDRNIKLTVARRIVWPIQQFPRLTFWFTIRILQLINKHFLKVDSAAAGGSPRSVRAHKDLARVLKVKLPNDIVRTRHCTSNRTNNRTSNRTSYGTSSSMRALEASDATGPSAASEGSRQTAGEGEAALDKVAGVLVASAHVFSNKELEANCVYMSVPLLISMGINLFPCSHSDGLFGDGPEALLPAAGAPSQADIEAFVYDLATLPFVADRDTLSALRQYYHDGREATLASALTIVPKRDDGKIPEVLTFDLCSSSAEV